MTNPTVPQLWCRCGGLVAMPDRPPETFRCDECGAETPVEPDALTRAYLNAAIGIVGVPAATAHAREGAVDSSDGTVTLWDESTGTRLGRLQHPHDDERTKAAQGPSIDVQGLHDVLAQVPQGAFSALLLHQMSGQVVLRVAPELAAQMSAGTARFMESSAGGLRSSVVSSSTNQVVGQASFERVPKTAIGLAGAWQVLSLVVAQKHLNDINERLGRMERSLGDLRELLDKDLHSEIQGDVDHLAAYVKSLDPDMDATSAALRRQRVDQIIGAARARHNKLLERLTLLEKRFTANRGAPSFGRTMRSNADDLGSDIEAFSRGVAALRLNAFLFAVANAVLRHLGEAEAYTSRLASDLERLVARDDEWLEQAARQIQASVLSIDGVFRSHASAAWERARLASATWSGACTAAELRSHLERARRAQRTESPRLLLDVRDGNVVTAARWIVDPEVAVES